MTDQKVRDILSELEREFEIGSEKIAEKKERHFKAQYELFTPLSEDDHRTIVEFEVAEDVLRVLLRHFFGSLDNSEALPFLLRENDGTFMQTSSFVVVCVMEDTPFLSLQSYHHFHMKWSARDIADMINLAIYDIRSGLAFAQFPEGVTVFHKGRLASE